MAERKGAMVQETKDVTAEEAPVEIPKAAVVPEPEPEFEEAALLAEDSGNPAEELFPGGPKWGEVNAWKEEFGDIYVTSFSPENHVVWRTLTRFEYKRLVKNMEMAVSTGQVTQTEANFNNEELMCEICVLHPKMAKSDMASHMAGVASIISQEIMEASGFVAMDVRVL